MVLLLRSRYFLPQYVKIFCGPLSFVAGDALDCSTYRAWAPGSPRRARKKFDCVVLTRTRTWVSTPCRKNYPMLCELVPGGPYQRGSLFASSKKANG